MADFEQLFIPSINLELDGDQELVRQIVAELHAVHLSEHDLLFCGIDGAGVLKSRSLDERELTFAVDYDELLKQAEVYDKIPSYWYSNPLAYVRMAEEVPALITYDRAHLVPVDREPMLWEAKKGSSLLHATRAVIFFADRETAKV